MPNSISLEQIEYLAKYDLEVKNLIARKVANNYEQFVNILHDDLDDSIQHLTQNRHLYQNFSEDQISVNLIGMLKARNYDADHDSQHGGHVDIIVKHQFGKFEWLGEAKIWGGPAYMADGWAQLNKRYSAGTINDNHGGILLYVKAPNAVAKLNDWIDHLKTIEDEIKISSETNPLVKNTITKHPSSGLDYRVRHIAVVLNHN